MAKDKQPAERPLSAKKAAFCESYLIDSCAAKAAIRVGYAPKYADRTAHNLMLDPAVKRRIAELQKARAERVQRDGDEVVRKLWETVDRCMNPEDFKPAPAIRALEQLGKHYGIFCVERLEISGPSGGSVPMSWAGKRDAETSKAARLLARRFHMGADDASAMN